MSLEAPYVLEYSYKRSCGPVIGHFLAALREGRLEGVRTKSGRVLCPPLEYDESGEPTGEFVALPNTGVITTWSWVARPRNNQPLQAPFAWALIRIDGADTAMLHAIDAPLARLKTGLQVRARFRDERVGKITDLHCFEPIE
jgi:uncharacterized OB-fold protein